MTSRRRTAVIANHHRPPKKCWSCGTVAAAAVENNNNSHHLYHHHIWEKQREAQVPVAVLQLRPLHFGPRGYRRRWRACQGHLHLQRRVVVLIHHRCRYRRRIAPHRPDENAPSKNRPRHHPVWPARLRTTIRLRPTQTIGSLPRWMLQRPRDRTPATTTPLPQQKLVSGRCSVNCFFG